MTLLKSVTSHTEQIKVIIENAQKESKIRWTKFDVKVYTVYRVNRLSCLSKNRTNIEREEILWNGIK